MAFNGAGVFVRLFSWTSDAANGINITASRMDSETDGIASGLSNCITRDGQGKPTAAIDFNGQNLTNVNQFAAANVLSGTYTPTLTNTANVAASTIQAPQWLRVGNVVTVSGFMTIQPTAAGNAVTTVGISLPIASNLAAAGQCAGTAVTTTLANSASWITSDTTNDIALVNFYASSTANAQWLFQFTYLIA